MTDFEAERDMGAKENDETTLAAHIAYLKWRREWEAKAASDAIASEGERP